jgi:hypothetical protein
MARQTQQILLVALSLIALMGLVFAEGRATGQQPSSSPIAVHFHLDHPGFVTLVIENERGLRVRNLVSEAFFPAGDQVAWWDGLDDLERDTNSAEHAVYSVPGRVVEPGTYTVRGLYRQQIDLKYEFAVYTPGQPPWMTSDTSSEWLTTHSPPGAVCFVPAGTVPAHGKRDMGSPDQVLIGSAVAEGGSGLAWVDLDGNKLHGQTWVGGVWTGAQQIARDLGHHSVPGIYAYVASSSNGELRLQKLVKSKESELKVPSDTRLGSGEDQAVLNSNWKYPKSDVEGLGGLAAYDGLLILSLPKMDELLLVDAALSRVIGMFPIPKPGGLFADDKGNLLVISQKKLLRIAIPDGARTGERLGTPRVIVGEGLEDPQQVTMDNKQNLYVSDWGKSNQVKIFSSQGKFLRSIGAAGVPASGPYNPRLMHHPKGITIDSRNQLWVAEEDFQPKRVSLWSLDGRLLRAFYGPVTYGGGGNLDPRDKTLFYLDGMTFRLNWATGESSLIEIYHRPKEGESELIPTTIQTTRTPQFQESGTHTQFAAGENPDLPFYVGDRRYFTNAYNSDATTGTSVAGIWIDKGGVAAPVAAFGRADSRQLFLTAAFRSHIPIPTNPQIDSGKPLDLSGYTFVWSDLNGDGVAEPGEITMVPGTVRSVTVSANMEITTDTAMSYKPVAFTKGGAPVYDLSKGMMLCPQTQRPTSTGGGQVLATGDDRTVLTTGPKPFASQSLAGAEHGIPKWSYPSLWPGLHASHIAPLPEFPGELIGTTRLLGPSFQLHKLRDVELWAINGNKGTIYLFTTDGLFVATLFKDSRSPGSSWAQRSKAIRGMSVTDLTTGEENFWPSITQTDDGQVYIVTSFPAIIRVDGLDSIRRLPPSTILVTAEMLEQAKAYFKTVELSRQRAAQASSTLIVPVDTAPLTLSGDLSKWDSKLFVTIDERSKLVGDWGRTKLQTLAALRVAGDRLFAAFKTGDPQAIDNSGASLQNLFKTGGGLDLMLATNPNSDPQRRSAAPGDIRLLVSLVKGKPVAVLYRPVATTAPRNSAIFESPLRTLRFDDVEDVSQYVQFAKGNADSSNGASAGDFEFSIPLRILGLNSIPGTELRGDVGLLRGDGVRTFQRAYWSDKATGLVSDIPSEAELTPQLWGRFRFVVDVENPK